MIITNVFKFSQHFRVVKRNMKKKTSVILTLPTCFIVHCGNIIIFVKFRATNAVPCWCTIDWRYIWKWVSNDRLQSQRGCNYALCPECERCQMKYIARCTYVQESDCASIISDAVNTSWCSRDMQLHKCFTWNHNSLCVPAISFKKKKNSQPFPMR